MHVNRFHWAISHYIGSQLRQCVLDPDGGTIYGFDHPRRLPSWFTARRLYPKACTEEDASAKVGASRPVADDVAGGVADDAPAEAPSEVVDETGAATEVSAAS